MNAALFFLFFALQIDTSELSGVALPAVGLAIVTAGIKAITGRRAAALAGVDDAARARAAVDRSSCASPTCFLRFVPTRSGLATEA